MRILLLASLPFLAAAATAQVEDWGEAKEEWAASPEYEESKALCRALRHREPPAADRPSVQERSSLQGCDSEALYYGIGRPADPVKARKCAFVEAEEDGNATPFSGRAMLMVIYANGVGAKRDLDVATHLACETGWAPAESHGRVSRLAAAKAESWTGTDFHYCDEATSGYVGGWCAGHAARIEGAKREAKLALLTRAWTAADKAGLARLRAAHEAYAEARADGEIDMTGTLRTAFWVGAKEHLADELLALLEALEQGRGAGAASDFEAADRALNAAYRKRMAGEFPEGAGSVTRDGVRSAQRAWLRYRDAFLAFGARKWPKVPRNVLAARLTEQRTRLLEGEEPF